MYNAFLTKDGDNTTDLYYFVLQISNVFCHYLRIPFEAISLTKLLRTM